jgi:hypothetical protein
MQSCHDGHFQVLQKLQDMTAGCSSEDPKLMLQAHDIDLG